MLEPKFPNNPAKLKLHHRETSGARICQRLIHFQNRSVIGVD